MTLKKYLLIVSAHLALSLSSELFAQNPNDALTKQLDELTSIYSKNLKPYLLQFAKLQSPQNLDSCERQRYQEAIVKMYEIKEEYILKELYSSFLKMPQRENYISSFSRTYQFEFPGLDYMYFKKCEDEAALLRKKK
ncbi:MAG: hypothetical protein L6Q51_04790 [Cyclobacteriaceae bacterium]|nr:hypothetical protein [Cyclobacteriaceae bacterium]